MRRPSPLVTFVLSSFALIVGLTLLWTKVSPWTSYPVAVLAHVTLEQATPMWVRAVHTRPGSIEVDTTVEVVVPQAGGRKAEITLDADPGRYAYGLPIFLALLLAAQTVGKSGSRWQRAFAGYLLLLPAQVFSLVMYLLMQMILAAQLNTRALRVDPWQLEAIVYGYQVGVLVLPTLAPILVWLWLDQQFFRSFFMPRWKQS